MFYCAGVSSFIHSVQSVRFRVRQSAERADLQVGARWRHGVGGQAVRAAHGRVRPVSAGRAHAAPAGRFVCRERAGGRGARRLCAVQDAQHLPRAGRGAARPPPAAAVEPPHPRRAAVRRRGLPAGAPPPPARGADAPRRACAVPPRAGAVAEDRHVRDGGRRRPLPVGVPAIRPRRTEHGAVDRAPGSRPSPGSQCDCAGSDQDQLEHAGDLPAGPRSERYGRFERVAICPGPPSFFG